MEALRLPGVSVGLLHSPPSDVLDALSSGEHCSEAHLLRGQGGAMQFPAVPSPAAFLTASVPLASLGEKLDVEPDVQRLTRSCIAANLRQTPTITSMPMPRSRSLAYSCVPVKPPVSASPEFQGTDDVKCSGKPESVSRGCVWGFISSNECRCRRANCLNGAVQPQKTVDDFVAVKAPEIIRIQQTSTSGLRQVPQQSLRNNRIL